MIGHALDGALQHVEGLFRRSGLLRGRGDGTRGWTSQALYSPATGQGGKDTGRAVDWPMKKSLFGAVTLLGLAVLGGCAKPTVVGKWDGTMQLGSIAAQTKLELTADGKALGNATTILGATPLNGTYKTEGGEDGDQHSPHRCRRDGRSANGRFGDDHDQRAVQTRRRLAHHRQEQL